VTHNTAPLGGGVYLLGEKARLETGSEARPYPGTTPGLTPSRFELNLTRFCVTESNQYRQRIP